MSYILNHNNIVFCFDDLLILPADQSDVSDENICVTTNKLGKSVLPIFSSPMSTITESRMLEAMRQNNCLGIHHRYCDIEVLIEATKNFPEMFMAVGTIKNHKSKIDKLIEAGCQNFAVDVANGAHTDAIETVKYLRAILPNANIISGSIATPIAAELVARSGANLVRVGIGSGSSCLTREVCGVGLPTAYSIEKIKHRLGNRNIIIVADGGIRNSGDISKALALGADFVILGGMLAATEETPGSIFIDTVGHGGTYHRELSKKEEEAYDKTLYLGIKKKYSGMASLDALLQNGKDPKNAKIEGDSFFVPYKGPVANIINQIKIALTQTMFYTGFTNLNEFRKDADMVLVTSNTAKENGAHGKVNI